MGNIATIADLLDSANNRVYGYQDYQYFLTQGDGPWGDLSWTYDFVGNRESETRDGVTDTYVYDQNAGSLGNTALLQSVQLGGGGLHSFAYDLTGNQTQVNLAGNVIDRTYDDAGRLATQERLLAEAATTFTYDGRSFLRQATGRGPDTSGNGIFCDGFESGDTTAWDGGGTPGPCFAEDEVEPLYDSGGVFHGRDGQVLYFVGRPIALVSSDETVAQYLTTNHLGTPIISTDGSSTEVWDGGFEPFGRDYAGADAADQYLRLPGQWQDEAWAESGLGDLLYYNVFRWFGPKTSRYSRPDPILIARAGSPFLYVHSRPLYFKDPLGLAAQPPRSERDPFRPPVDPSFGSGPWGDRPNSECCDENEIEKAIESVDGQLGRMQSGSSPTGIVGGMTLKGHSCGEGGWCIPLPDAPEDFDPGITDANSDPCVIYCIRVHEWIHFQDRRPWNKNWSDFKLNQF